MDSGNIDNSIKFGAVRNRDREELKEYYNDLIIASEKTQMTASKLVDGTEFFLSNSVNNISVKDSKVSNAKSILQATVHIFDEKIKELQAVIIMIDSSLRDIEAVIPRLDKFQMDNQIKDVTIVSDALKELKPKIASYEEPVELAKKATIAKVKKTIIHMHKNEFINRLK